jgi:hypothetical protein
MAKIITTKTPKVGLALLQLFDAATMQPLDTMLNVKATQNFSLSALGNTTSSWKIVIPQECKEYNTAFSKIRQLL